MQAAYPTTSTESDHDTAMARIVAAQLSGLAALREVGVGLAGQLTAYAKGELPKELEKPFEGESAIRALARVARAVRQIISMEQEILGLRPMPDDSGGYHAGRMARAYRTIRWGSDEYDPDDLRDPNDLSEPSDLDDYDRGPADQVIAGIRKVLGVAEDDPAIPSFSPSFPHSLRGSTPLHVSKVRVDACNEYGHDEKSVQTGKVISTRSRDPP